MEIRNLNTFSKVAEAQSLSKAAAELGYAQSTVTMQMQQLEQEMGARLYERVGKKIRITREGQELLLIAEQIIRMSQDALRIGKRDAGAVDGTLRIGVLDALISKSFTEPIQEYLKRFPQVELEILTGRSTAELLEKLKHNELDLAMTLDHPLTDPMLIQQEKRREDVHFFGATGRHLAVSGVQPENVLRERLMQETILLGNGENVWERELEAWSRAEHPSGIVRIGNPQMAFAMAAAGCGILAAPDSAALEYVENERLETLPYELQVRDMWIQTLYHRNKWITGAMNAWFDMRGGTADGSSESGGGAVVSRSAEHL